LFSAVLDIEGSFQSPRLFFGFSDPHQPMPMHTPFPQAPVLPLNVAAPYHRMPLTGGGLTTVGQQYRVYPSLPAPPPGLMPPPMGHQLHYMQAQSAAHMLHPATYMNSQPQGHPQLLGYPGGAQVLRPAHHFQMPTGPMQISAPRSSPMGEVVSPTMEMQHGGGGMYYTLQDGSRVRTDMMAPQMYYGLPQGMVAAGIGGGQPLGPPQERSRSPPRRHTAAIPIVNPQV